MQYEPASGCDLQAMLGEYAGMLASLGREAAIGQLCLRLSSASGPEWLSIRAMLRREGAEVAADRILRQAYARFPADTDVSLAYASWLRDHGRIAAAGKAVMACASKASPAQRINWSICRFLEDSGLHQLAWDYCEPLLRDGSEGAESQVRAGRLAMQLGMFARARKCFMRAISHGVDVYRWHVAQALANCQRYENRQHTDIAMFERWLEDASQTADARASLLFALGKCMDDVGEYSLAAEHWRNANALMRRSMTWSSAGWLRDRELRAGVGTLHRPVHSNRLAWTPVFIVGMPRSGTTLVAELLAGGPGVRNRGELMWIPQLSDQLLNGGRGNDSSELGRAARAYARLVRQDDAAAQWYIDKQTFNFLHVGLIVAMFPNARIVYCTRDARDTALSIWSRHFAGDRAGFAYDFDAIAALAGGCEKSMKHWCGRFPEHIHRVSYEQVVTDPHGTITQLALALGMRPWDGIGVTIRNAASISTSSLWQVRQSIYQSSMHRWRKYASFIPELERKFSCEPHTFG